jgi:phosphatidylinositol-3-phosphatase
MLQARSARSMLALIMLSVAAVSASWAMAMPRYDHIFIIIAENKRYEQIIGSADAPNLNALAAKYGLATNFYGETHPSEPNYVAMLGGETFGITDDDAWYCQPGQPAPFCTHATDANYAPHTVAARSLMDQLDEAKLTWKGYFEDLPAPGSTVVYDPSPERKDKRRPDDLYASKHNGFLNFARVQRDPRIAEKIVPLTQLDADLNATAPNYAHIVLNQCNEMHGLSGDKVDKDCEGNTPAAFSALIRRGDRAIGAVVNKILASPLWAASGNVAVVITFDEDDARDFTGTQGCCGVEPGSRANFGGGHVPTIVVTNHGPHDGRMDRTPYNHYSLLRTMRRGFRAHRISGARRRRRQRCQADDAAVRCRAREMMAKQRGAEVSKLRSDDGVIARSAATKQSRNHMRVAGLPRSRSQ